MRGMDENGKGEEDQENAEEENEQNEEQEGLEDRHWSQCQSFESTKKHYGIVYWM